jgi:thymidylate synthase (FAD)
MKVELLHNTPLWVCAKAIRKCWASEDKSDTTTEYDDVEHRYITMTGDKDKELINRVGNKNKHKSTLEHLVYTFDVDGISRACLQELARHRIASYSVKSTRYTLKELKEADKMKHFLVLTGNTELDYANIDYLLLLKNKLLAGSIANDVAKYMLPEAYKTSLVMTINARSLQNFIELRSSKSALWEIQNLAKAMYDAIPEEHKYLFEDYIS